MNELKKFLNDGYTPFHVCENAARLLDAASFKRVDKVPPRLNAGDKFYIAEGGALTAFNVGGGDGFMIVASHTDSPALKIKSGILPGGRPNCEVYGGALRYSFFDTPLKICGQVYTKTANGIAAKTVVSDYFVTVPSLAIHLNRNANDGFSPSAQNDLSPLLGENAENFISELVGGEVVDYDLCACPASPAYESGINREYLCSPRIDNLTSVYCSLVAVASTAPKVTNVCVLFDGEETGSRVRRGAASVFFPELLKEVYTACGGKNFFNAIDSSLMLSADNAHATHPAHTEKSDPVNKVTMNGGIVIKHNPNYATDGLTSATAKLIFEKAGAKTQDFYSNSDSPCGSTLGLISAANTDIRACDIGIAQLAMHSATETCGKDDIVTMTAGLKSFYSSSVSFGKHGVKIN